MHANKIRKFAEQTESAVVVKCAVVYERDREFGRLLTCYSGGGIQRGSPISQF